MSDEMLQIETKQTVNQPRFPDPLTPDTRTKVTELRSALSHIVANASSDVPYPIPHAAPRDSELIRNSTLNNVGELGQLEGLSPEFQAHITGIMEQELRAAGLLTQGAGLYTPDEIRKNYQRWVMSDINRMSAEDRIKELTVAGRSVPDNATPFQIAQIYKNYIDDMKRDEQAANEKARDQIVQDTITLQEVRGQLTNDSQGNSIPEWARQQSEEQLPPEVVQARTNILDMMQIIDKAVNLPVDKGRIATLGGLGLRIYRGLSYEEAAKQLEEDMKDPAKRIQIAATLAGDEEAIAKMKTVPAYTQPTLVLKAGTSIKLQKYTPYGFVSDTRAEFQLFDAGVDIDAVKIASVQSIKTQDDRVVFNRDPYIKAVEDLNKSISPSKTN